MLILTDDVGFGASYIRGDPQAKRVQHGLVRQEPNVPDWRSSQAGPFDLWPTGLGFEYFYGFIGGDTSQWAPALYEKNKPIEPPHDDPNYFFEKAMADHAIARMRMLHAVAPDKPWLAYYAPGMARRNES